jgi:urease accessory protein
VRRARVTVAALAATGLPSAAEAHLVATGLGPVYDGISHVLMSPDDLVPVMAMALLAGLNGPAAGRRTLFVLTAAWLVGGLLGYLFAKPVVTGIASTASFLVLGVLVAMDRRLKPAIIALVAMALGLLHGGLNGAGIAEAEREALGLAGIAAAVFVVVALVAAFVSTLESGWTRVAVRVAGSWVTAIGMLMLGWGLRGTP